MAGNCNDRRARGRVSASPRDGTPTRNLLAQRFPTTTSRIAARTRSGSDNGSSRYSRANNSRSRNEKPLVAVEVERRFWQNEPNFLSYFQLLDFSDKHYRPGGTDDERADSPLDHQVHAGGRELGVRYLLGRPCRGKRRSRTPHAHLPTFAGHSVAQPHAGAAAILIDEFDADAFVRG